MKTTIREIAAAAGVNASTVSRVLSGRATETRIPEATALRVQKTADKLGYAPNLLARGLKTSRTHTLGLILTDLSNSFFAGIAGAVEAQAMKEGFTTIIAASGEDPKREADYLRTLRARPTDGLIVTPAPGDRVRKLLQQIAKEKYPLVLIDRDVRAIDCARVLSESRKGAALLVDELAQLGCKRIAFAAGPTNVWTASQRLSGFQEGLKRNGLSQHERLIHKGPYTEAHGREAARQFLSSKKSPDGIVAANNKILIGVLEVLAEAGQQARGLPVAGFDGVPLAGFLGRPLIIAKQPVEDIGRTATKLLIERINGATKAAKAVHLPLEIQRYGI